MRSHGRVQIAQGRLIDGSTKITLDTRGFDYYVFVEQDMAHVEELRCVCEPYEKDGVNIRIVPGEANDLLLSQVTGYPWNVQGLAFLDPYGIDRNFLYQRFPEGPTRLRTRLRQDQGVLVAHSKERRKANHRHATLVRKQRERRAGGGNAKSGSPTG
ncbi:MAG: hypothetical protein C7B45_01025 [Sulfobacillus acidophilus]|uniref:Uncharacterized protein n=1 Tax=Sulfobacillus acidophilus TaxID=53633 RepID=A0A2T2WNU0_9FIRM|nr:MAG: hypothetical protein C7B45_01025 [Sulfobacillus acidophilus]